LQNVSSSFCEVYGTAALGPIVALQQGEIAERPTSVGRPLPLVEVEIANDTGERVDPGITGQLRCRGPGLGWPAAYSNGDKDFRDGWHYPGELAATDENGYVFLQGRVSEVIFRGGAKIFPSEIEAVLQEHARVIEAAVVGQAVSESEQEPVAYVVVRDALSADELLAYCSTRLTAFKVPRKINIVPDLPRNLSGKIDKRALVH